MNNGWNEQLRKSLLKNLEKNAEVEQEIIESITFFDFITISLVRKNLLYPVGSLLKIWGLSPAMDQKKTNL